MSSNVVMRNATERDLDVVLRFIRELAEYERLAHEVVATTEDLRQSLFCDNPIAHAVIASIDDADAGLALYYRSFSTFLGKPCIYLEDLYVSPEFRGFGVGKELLGRMARIAVDEGAPRLEWSVLDWNQPAIDFYAGLGAEVMDEWTVNRVTGEALRRLAGGRAVTK